jgi:F0F1-type ATP synthase assembly protein I
MDEDLKKTIKTLGYMSTIGIAMALSIAIGVFIGYYIDRKFGTTPWFFYIFLCLGIAAAFRNLYVLYKRGKDL